MVQTTQPTPAEPLIGFEKDGRPDVLSSNVPEPVSYNGRNYVDLGVPSSSFAEMWLMATYQVPPEVNDPAPAKQQQVAREVALAMKNGFDSQATNGNTPLDKYFPGFPEELRGRLKYAGPLPDSPDPNSPGNYILLTEPTSPDDLSAATSVPVMPQRYSGIYLLDEGRARVDRLLPALRMLTPGDVIAALKQGKLLKIVQDLDGNYSYTYLPVPKSPAPILALVEHYRLTTFLGRYGASRTIKTLSLLPGERAKITMSSYTRRTETLKQASSILDSLTKESSEDFEDTVQSEITDKQAAARSDEWQVEAKIQGRWGTGSASLSAGYAGSLNSMREQTVKNVKNAVQKHAAKASSKRNVNVEQSSDSKTESGEETAVVREVQNINVGRTLNFVFRQMSQEYVSLLHLVDVSVAFSNGMPGSDRLVPLWKLESLLNEVIAEPPRGGLSRSQVRELILRELRYVRDDQDTYQRFYEEYKPTVIEGGKTVGIDAYIRPRRDLSYTYNVAGRPVTVPGILLGASTNVMYTDGVVVDTLLGQSEALDDYSKRVRDTAAGAEAVGNDLLAADLSIEQLRQQIVNGKQPAQAAAFALIYPQPAQ